MHQRDHHVHTYLQYINDLIGWSRSAEWFRSVQTINMQILLVYYDIMYVSLCVYMYTWSSNSYYPRNGATWVSCPWADVVTRACCIFPSGKLMRHFNKFFIEMTAFTFRQNLLHMQHHFLCNISYVVITLSMGKSLKYTTMYNVLVTV